MTDDQYHSLDDSLSPPGGNGNLPTRGNERYPPNLENTVNMPSAQGGGQDSAINYSQQESYSAHTPESLRAEHSRAKDAAFALTSRLKHKKEDYSADNIRQMSKKSEEALSSAGIPNLDNIPESVRHYYVRAYNLIAPPKKRFRKIKSSLDSILNEVETIDSDIKNDLYGPNYNSKNTLVGGLYGRVSELAIQRKDYGDAVISLKEDIGDADARLREAKKLLGEQATSEKRKGLAETVVGITFDIEVFKHDCEEFIFSFDATDHAVKIVNDEIDGLKALRTQLSRFGREVRSTTTRYNQTTRNTNYVGATLHLTDIFHKIVTQYNDLAEKMEDVSYSYKEKIAKMSERPIETSPRPQQRGDPLEVILKEREEQEESIMARIKEIQQNPFPDLRF